MRLCRLSLDCVYVGECFLLVGVLEVFWSLLVGANSPRYFAKSVFSTVLTCKVSYDPS